MEVLYYEKLTALRIKELCNANRVMLLTFGSVEQHGDHLPVGTDYICMLKRVEEIAQKTGSVVFAPIQLGYSFNHTAMVGTISLEAEVFLKVVCQILCQIFEQGWKRCIVFSGHNGNWATIKVAIQIATEKYPEAQIIPAQGYPKIEDEIAKRRLRNFDYHAGVVETAIVAHLCEDLLDTQHLPSGNVNLPPYILTLINKKNIDDINELLVTAMTPQHTKIISDNGIWGRSDPKFYSKVNVAEAMRNYVDFFVELIQRWDDIVL